MTLHQELLDEKLTTIDPWQSTGGTSNDTTGGNDIQCGVWLAPSTIVGAGMGMFAGRDFDDEEEIKREKFSLIKVPQKAY